METAGSHPVHPQHVARPLTQPFGFAHYLRVLQPCTRRPTHTWACLQVWLIALGLYMLSSHYVLMPGIPIALPCLPQTDSLSSTYAPERLVLVSPEMILWQDRPYRLDTLPQTLSQELRGQTLLVQCQHNTDVDSLLSVCHWAQAIGYQHIHICTSTSHVTDLAFPKS